MVIPSFIVAECNFAWQWEKCCSQPALKNIDGIIFCGEGPGFFGIP